MAKASLTAHWLTTASAAAVFEGSTQPEERTLIDACRTPFAFGLSLLVPVALIVGTFDARNLPRQRRVAVKLALLIKKLKRREPDTLIEISHRRKIICHVRVTGSIEYECVH